MFDGGLDDVLGTLQQRTQIGWLNEEPLKYDGFRGRFLGVRANLLERLGRLADSNDSDERAALFRDAHGFLASATHLYRALGLDVTITLRFPDTETLLRKDDVHEDFRRFIRHTVPKHGAYGVHSVYRCMFESREDKVNFAMSPEIDPDDPAVTPTTSWVFAGPSISSAEDVVRDALEATAGDDQLDDRPHDPIAFDIPDETDPDHEQYHGRYGAVTAVIEDDALTETGDERNAIIYRVKFDDGSTADFRWRDLRPPLKE